MASKAKPVKHDQKPGKKVAAAGKAGKIAGKPEDRMETMRSHLLRRRKEILNQAKDQISNSASGDIRQLVDTALDEGDLAEITIQEDLKLKMLSKYRDTLHDIDEALRKMKEGTYGTCEECGEEISENRLNAVPTTRYCISCQELKEQLERAEGRTDQIVSTAY